MDRRWLRGRYLRGHVVVLVLAGLFALAGKWQLDRLHQVRQRNALVRSHMQSAAVPLDDVVKAGTTVSGDAAYRRVEVIGRYDPGHPVLVEFRSYIDDPGYYLLAPMVTPNGDAIWVNRGWIPLSNAPAQRVAQLAPPTGDVHVAGILFPPEKGGAAPTESGGVTVITRVDLARLRSVLGSSSYPVYLQLTSQEPKQSGPYPIVLPLPTLDEGPHLSYAIQWFLFTAIALIGWPLLLRRALRTGQSAAGRDVR